MQLTNKKKLIFGSIIGILLGTLVGSAYAFFTFQQTGANQQLITGDIYMRYTESNEVVMENMFPTSGPVEGQYIEFDITGKNTSNKTIYYEILLNHGNDITGKTRIGDQFLRFKLVEVNNNVEGSDLLGATSYNLINGNRIYVSTIGTTNSYTKKYRLYVWIDSGVTIYQGSDLTSGDGNYSASQWNNLFGSIRVDVHGDFSEKGLPVTINLNANGGSVSQSTIELTTISTSYGTLPTPTATGTVAGYEFVGWYTDATNGTKVESNDSFTYGTSPTTLYAHWEEPVTIECPGEECYYMYTTNTYQYSESGNGTTRTKIEDEDHVTLSSDYTDVITNDRKYFLGVKFDGSGKIEKAYACGEENGTPFCLEGYTDGRKQAANIAVLTGGTTPLFSNCDSLGSNFFCDDSLTANVESSGYVYVAVVDDSHAYTRCSVFIGGALRCTEG